MSRRERERWRGICAGRQDRDGDYGRKNKKGERIYGGMLVKKRNEAGWVNGVKGMRERKEETISGMPWEESLGVNKRVREKETSYRR